MVFVFLGLEYSTPSFTCIVPDFILFKSRIALQCVNVPPSLTHSFAEGHLVCFQFQAVVGRSTMNTVGHVSLWEDEASFGNMV